MHRIRKCKSKSKNLPLGSQKPAKIASQANPTYFSEGQSDRPAIPLHEFSSPINFYYNTDFSTFRKSSNSSSFNSNNPHVSNSFKRRSEIGRSEFTRSLIGSSEIEKGLGSDTEGYLKPIRNGREGLFFMDIPPVEMEVAVDVHTPTSSNFSEEIESSGSTITNLPNKFSSLGRCMVKESFCEKFCSLCATSLNSPKSKSPKMDVTVISSHGCFFSRNAEAHLRLFFEQMVTPDREKLDIRVAGYDLQDMEYTAVAGEVHRAKVQIVIVSHQFLDRLKHEAEKRKRISPINRILRPSRVIAVLLNMNPQLIEDEYENVLAQFSQWCAIELRSTSRLDPDFCKKFTEQVEKIFNVEVDTPSSFSLFPHKIGRDGRRVMVNLKKPLPSNMNLTATVYRGEESTTISNLILLNPFSALMRIPESICGDETCLLEVSIYRNSEKLGTKHLKYEASSGLSGERVMDNILKISDVHEAYDEEITKKLAVHFNASTDFKTDESLGYLNEMLISRGNEFPTLMHYGAFYGLKNMIWTVLLHGDGIDQCNVTNDMGETPFDVAGTRGHHETIGKTIREYENMTRSYAAFQRVKNLVERRSLLHGDEELENKLDKLLLSEPNIDEEEEFTDAFEEPEEKPEQVKPIPHARNLKLKIPSVSPNILHSYENIPISPEIPRRNKGAEQITTSEGSTEYYDIPRDENSDYKIPPRPVAINGGESPTKLCVSSTDLEYIDMAPTNFSVEPTFVKADKSTPDKLEKFERNKKYPTVPPIAVCQLPILGKHNPPLTPRATERIKNHLPQDPNEVRRRGTIDPLDEELAMLLKGYKNHDYTFEKLENLFENWKKRSDDQKSNDLRRQELIKMSKEYTDIVTKGKTKTFDKIFRIFGKKKTSNVERPIIEEVIKLPEYKEMTMTEVKTDCDRLSIESRTSGGDSGLSDPDSDKPDKHTSGIESRAKSWTNPTNQRFGVGSYIEADNLGKFGHEPLNVESSANLGQITYVNEPIIEAPIPPRPPKTKVLDLSLNDRTSGRKVSGDLIPIPYQPSPPLPPRNQKKDGKSTLIANGNNGEIKREKSSSKIWKKKKGSV